MDKNLIDAIRQANSYGVSIQVVTQRDQIKAVGVHIPRPSIEEIYEGLAIALERGFNQIFLYVHIIN